MGDDEEETGGMFILDLVTHTNVDSHRSYPMSLQILISCQQYHTHMGHAIINYFIQFFFPNVF